MTDTPIPSFDDVQQWVEENHRRDRRIKIIWFAISLPLLVIGWMLGPADGAEGSEIGFFLFFLGNLAFLINLVRDSERRPSRKHILPVSDSQRDEGARQLSEIPEAADLPPVTREIATILVGLEPAQWAAFGAAAKRSCALDRELRWPACRAELADLMAAQKQIPKFKRKRISEVVTLAALDRMEPSSAEFSPAFEKARVVVDALVARSRLPIDPPFTEYRLALQTLHTAIALEEKVYPPMKIIRTFDHVVGTSYWDSFAR